MIVLAFLLLLGSGFFALMGLAAMSQATYGVGGIALACLLAIVARICQAAGNHGEVLRAIRQPATATTPPRRAVNFCTYCGAAADHERAACPACGKAYEPVPVLPPLPKD